VTLPDDCCLGGEGGGAGGGDGFAEGAGGFLEITGFGFQDLLCFCELICQTLRTISEEMAVLEAAPASAPPPEADSWNPYSRMALMAENFDQNCETRLYGCRRSYITGG
jgi:hypothetical protein